MTVESKGQGYIRKQETDLLQIGLLSLIINFWISDYMLI